MALLVVLGAAMFYQYLIVGAVFLVGGIFETKKQVLYCLIPIYPALPLVFRPLKVVLLFLKKAHLFVLGRWKELK